MNITTSEIYNSISDQLLSCQENIFSAASAIEIQGWLSIASWGGLLCLFLILSNAFHNSDCACFIFLIPSVIGGISGSTGIIGNLILAPIILGKCESNAGYAFVSSICFLVSLVTLFIGAIPSIVLCIVGKHKAFYAIIITFGFIAGLAYIVGNIASFYQWSQYVKKNK